MTIQHWRARTWAAHPELLAVGAAGEAVGRAVLRVGPVVGADLGVPEPWGVQVTAGELLPDAAVAAAALSWCRERGRTAGWRVSVPQRLVGRGPWRGLVPWTETGVYATAGTVAARLEARLPAGVELVPDPCHEDVVAAYGGWMGDRPLAARLLLPTDLARPDRGFVVARRGARPVGCALVWWAVGTGYLSGIGVLPDERGRGIGQALTVAAARIAAAGGAGHPPDVVWMHATPEGAALYARLGFTRVDTEVLLGPPGTGRGT